MMLIQSILLYGLIFVGLVTISLAVYGLLWMPDIYTKLHAYSQGTYLGVMSFVAAGIVAAGSDFALKSFLVITILLLTSAISSHVIGRAAFISKYPMRAGKDQAETKELRESEEPQNPSEVS